MPGSAEKILDLIEQRKLLPQFTIDSLRRQIAAAPDELNANHVARLLQRKGKITAFQARELLAEVFGRQADSQPADRASTSTAPAESTAAKPDEDDELGLALDDDAPVGKHERLEKIAAAAPRQDEGGIIEDPGDALQSLDEPTAPPTPAAPSPTQSGIADLLDDPLVSSAADPLAAPAKSGYVKKSRSDWGSPLMIVGGGVLILLIILGIWLPFVLKRDSGDELFAAAEKEYFDGSYRSAIERYEEFVGAHGNHPDASLARVRLALAKIRKSSAQHDWLQALVTAQNVLPAVEQEAALSGVRPELAGMLRDIANGLAEQAANAPDQVQARQTVDLFRQAKELAQTPVYVPSDKREEQAAKLEEAQREVDDVVRGIERGGKLAESIAAMKAAVDRGDVNAAYQIHAELIKLYSELERNRQVQAAARAISARLVDLVAVTDESIASATDEQPNVVSAEIAFFSRGGKVLTGVDGAIAPFLIEGTLYALDATDGRLLWRRFVGWDSQSPARVDEDGGADVLVADTRGQELLRLSARDGRMIWRLPVGEPFEFAPTNETIFVSALSGRLLAVDAKTGNCDRQVPFPQRLAGGVAVDEAGDLIVQLGEHANAYVLQRRSLECVGVGYLGHKAGTIGATPTVAAGMLLVPHNVGLSKFQLFALPVAGQEAARDALTTKELPGRVSARLIVAGQRVIAVNDRGGVHVFEIDLTDAKSPLRPVGETTGNLDGQAVFPLLAGDRLVVADRRLAAFGLPASSGSPTTVWIHHQNDTFVAPPQLIGPYVVHARRRPNVAGVVIAAALVADPQSSNSGQPIWQTLIAPEAPPGGVVPAVEQNRLTVYCSTGQLYDVSMEETDGRVVGTPLASPPSLGNFSECIAIENGIQALTENAPPHRILIDNAAASPRLTVAKTDGPLPGGHYRPAGWRKGLLLPLDGGQVAYWQPSPQASALHPFQAKLVVGEDIVWKRPLALSDEHIVLAREDGQLYLVGVDETGAPHLAAAAKTKVDGKIVGPLAALDGRALVVCSDASSERLWSLERELFEADTSRELPGRLRWGPFTAGELVLLATEPGGLMALDTAGDERWKIDVEGQLPVGRPLVDGEQVMIATTSGRIWAIDAAGGETLKTIDVRQPLSDGPALVHSRLVVRTADGSVLIVKHIELE